MHRLAILFAARTDRGALTSVALVAVAHCARPKQYPRRHVPSRGRSNCRSHVRPALHVDPDPRFRASRIPGQAERPAARRGRRSLGPARVKSPAVADWRCSSQYIPCRPARFAQPCSRQPGCNPLRSGPGCSDRNCGGEGRAVEWQGVTLGDATDSAAGRTNTGYRPAAGPARNLSARGAGCLPRRGRRGSVTVAAQALILSSSSPINQPDCTV